MYGSLDKKSVTEVDTTPDWPYNTSMDAREPQFRPQWPLFIVYETNADLESVKAVDIGIHKDILETRMVQNFTKSGCAVDFMMIDNSNREMCSLLLSDRSKMLRGECLG